MSLLTRRELPGTLAATPLAFGQRKGFHATGVNHVSYVAPSGVKPAQWRATSVNHVGFVSAYYEKARDWYQELFDLRLSHESGSDCHEWMGDTVWSPRKARASDGKRPPQPGRGRG